MKWNYGAMTDEQIREYVSRKIQTSPALKFDGPLNDNVTHIIFKAHSFSKSKLGESAVSQRDLQRVFRILSYLLNRDTSVCNCELCRARASENSKSEMKSKVLKKCLVAVYFCYGLRLLDQNRKY